MTIGDVLRLPRETLSSRFGVILPDRLDQVLGLLHETFTYERLKEPMSSVREWEVPIDDRFILGLACREMLREVLSLAERHGMGVQELEGMLQTESGKFTIEIKLVEPTRDDAHIAQLVELQLERQTWSGGIIAVRWDALRLGRLEQSQGSLFHEDSETKTSRSYKTLVERLSSRLDASAVLRVEFVADSQPEHVVRLVPWTKTKPPGPDGFMPHMEHSRGRPCRLFGSPVPIEVTSIVPDGPPIRMMWQREECLVARTWGPERIATGWWRGGHRARLLPHGMGRRHTGLGVSRPAQWPLVSPRLFRLNEHARTAAFQTLSTYDRPRHDSRGHPDGPLCRASLQDKLFFPGRCFSSQRAGRPRGHAWL